MNIGMGIQYQETSLWCWIAVAASVAHFYNPSSGVLAAHHGLAETLAHPYGTAAEFALEAVGIPAMRIKSGGVGDALDVNGNNAGYHSQAPLAQVISECWTTGSWCSTLATGRA